MVRHALAADLGRTPPLPDGMDQLDPVGIDDTEDRGLSEKPRRKVPMPLEQAKQAGALRQLRKQPLAIPEQPAVKRPIAYAFDGKQEGHRHNFARVEHRLRMLGYVAQGIIYSTKQLGDTIQGGHEARSLARVW